MPRHILTQIYEIQTPKEAEALVDLGVDHIGSVIVSAGDWKQPVVRETVRLVSDMQARSSLILLYHDPDLVLLSLDYYQPDIIHFCEMLIDPLRRSIIEDEAKKCCDLQKLVKERFPEIQIMRSIPMPAKGDNNSLPVIELARIFEPVSDYFLTDTIIMTDEGQVDQPVCGFVGITGKTCDWEIAAGLVNKSRIPVILAGGLSPDNVYAAIAAIGPAGVDSCTLTNAVDGDGLPVRFKKDIEKVRRFIAETRRAEKRF